MGEFNLTDVLVASIFAIKTNVKFAKYGDGSPFPTKTTWLKRFISSPTFTESCTEEYCKTTAAEASEFYSNMTLSILDGSADGREKQWIELFSKPTVELMEMWKIYSALDYFFKYSDHRLSYDQLTAEVGQKIDFNGKILEIRRVMPTGFDKYGFPFTYCILENDLGNLAKIIITDGSKLSVTMDNQRWKIGDMLAVQGKVKSLGENTKGIMSKVIHLTHTKVIDFTSCNG